MDELGLHITRPYKDIFSFDSRKVKCLGLIKDLVVSLAQIHSKNLLMDVVVADIPPKFGMSIVQVVGFKIEGSPADGYVVHHYSCLHQERRL
jgi:hypothetical protein